MKLSTGIDLVELSILSPLALCAPPGDIPFYGGAAIKFFNPPCGCVLAVNGKEVMQYSPGLIDIEIVCSVGDIIKPITDSENRYGFIIAVGKDAEDALDKAGKAAAIHFITDKMP